MAESRKKYSREFKGQAVRMLEEGEKRGHEIGKELGIASGQVYRWRRALEPEGREGIVAVLGNGNPRDEELARLRKENRELREDREILRKALPIFSNNRK